jgi:hypothetical protein
LEIAMKRWLAPVIAFVLGVAPVALASDSAPNFVRVPSTTTASLSGSDTINGLLGGSLTVGRFKVRVPPGAYIGKATITIVVPDRSVLQANLEISPASANRFLVPVVLETNVTGATVSGSIVSNLLLLNTITRNESTGAWQLLPNVSVNVLNRTTYTPLFHFSKYGIVYGKGGW